MSLRHILEANGASGLLNDGTSLVMRDRDRNLLWGFGTDGINCDRQALSVKLDVIETEWP
jgi:hypothetical protein